MAETVGASSPIRDPNKPSLFFAGGDVQQVRGVAMGAAVTQGWQIQNTPGDSLILQRNLDNAKMEALTPGGSRGPLPPLVEVRSDFFPRAGGVDVQLAAQVISRRGTAKESRQDYTENYRNELTHSLANLHSTWQETGPRIANALPPVGGLRDAQPNASEAEDAFLAQRASGHEAAEVDANLAGSPVAFESDQEPRPAPVDHSAAATWALPAAGATPAMAAATNRANALHTASTKVPASPALPSTIPAPVANRSIASASPSPLAANSPSHSPPAPLAKVSSYGMPATATSSRAAVNTTKPLPPAAKATAPSTSSQAATLASQPAASTAKTTTTLTAKVASTTPRDNKTLTTPVGKPSATGILKSEATKSAKPAQPASPPATTAVSAPKAIPPTKATGNSPQQLFIKPATNPKPAPKAEATPSHPLSTANPAKTTAPATRTAPKTSTSTTKTAANSTSTRD